MMFLLDTDHLSILQRRAGVEYQRLSTWMASFANTEFACSVISLHEQLVGAHAFLNQAKDSTGLIRGYELLERLPRDYLAFTLLPFNAPCAATYDTLVALSLRIASMDLRIAAIALSKNLTLLTRNARDFSRIPGLKFEDRTV